MTRGITEKIRPVLFRSALPAGIVTALMLASMAVYLNSWRTDSVALYRAVAFAAGILLFISIGYGAFFVYPFAYFRGAGVWERIAASLAAPTVWLAKELARVSEFFTPGETVYYMFNSLFLLTFIGAFAHMGICELLCRRAAKRRGDSSIKVVTPLPVIAIIAGITALFLLLIWGLGVHFFYIYMEGYRAIFR